jgi:cytochrome c553
MSCSYSQARVPKNPLRTLLAAVLAGLPLSILMLSGCAGGIAGQDQRAATADLDRGEYMVNLLACGRCHTEGYLTGNEAQGPILAGSTVGIAYTPDRAGIAPGLAFAPNLTSDPETGLGSWTEDEIIRAMTSGVGKYGHRRLPVMPSVNYTALTQDDLRAIARYLKRLPPVSRRIPKSTAAGEPSNRPYVRYGLYTFDPEGRVRTRELP